MTENKPVAQESGDELNPHGVQKFSIIDLLMVIMIVGVLLTMYFPLKQTQKHEKFVRESIATMKTIINANEQFKATDGDYAFDISQLNLKEINKPEDTFQFTVSDTAIVASTKKLAVDEKLYYYDLRDKRFRVPKESKDIIIPDWLP